MAYFVKKDKDGIKYRDFLNSSQIKEADELLHYLQDNFPSYTKNLSDKYSEGSSIYFYYMGVWIRSVIEEHHIPITARKYLFSEIASFAPDKERLRNVSDNRNPYYQAYLLSDLPEDIVKKMSFNKWQSLLEREAEREEHRIFDWIGLTNQDDITIKEWRDFLKLLHAYTKKIDTSVFSDDELFSVYNMMIDAVKSWGKGSKLYIRKYPDSKKLKDSKNANKWQSKYFEKILGDIFTSERIPQEEDRLKWIEDLLTKGIKEQTEE